MSAPFGRRIAQEQDTGSLLPDNLDITILAGEGVRRRNRVGKDDERGSIATACEGAALELCLNAIRDAGFVVARAQQSPSSPALQGIDAEAEQAPSAADRFTLWAIQNSIFEWGSIDWLDAQSKAEELGLILAEEYDPERHGDKGGDYDPGDQIFVLSNDMRDVGKRVRGLP